MATYMYMHVCIVPLVITGHTFMGVAHFRSERLERPEEGGVGGVDWVDVLADPVLFRTDITCTWKGK